jgi:hypothetical protein
VRPAGDDVAAHPARARLQIVRLVFCPHFRFRDGEQPGDATCPRHGTTPIGSPFGAAFPEMLDRSWSSAFIGQNFTCTTVDFRKR